MSDRTKFITLVVVAFALVIINEIQPEPLLTTLFKSIGF